ncbi:MAG: hypothetical protein ABI390_09185 [Daejeonella sp.]
MKILISILLIVLMSACTQSRQKFENVEKGMSMQEVSLNAGEPSEKKNLGNIELWVYKDADRTVVFRHDSVFTIITSAEARADSIEMIVNKAGNDLKKGVIKAGDKLDSLGGNLIEQFSEDSIERNR